MRLPVHLRYSFLIMRPIVYAIGGLVMSFASQLGAQTAPIRIGPGVTAPRVLRKVEPEFSPLGRADQIQGTVVLQLVVTEKGRPADIQVISPLGYGLDENAVAAIQKWQFMPGQKDGAPVPVRATIEVNFRFVGAAFDESYEHKRTQFNVALQELRHVDTNPSQAARVRAVQSMTKLSEQKFPSAVYLVGMWEVSGEMAPAVAQDVTAGWSKIEQAAKKSYGPAIYRLARRSLDSSTDGGKTWDDMRRAATLGSREAQFLLGDRYQKGDGVEVSFDRAKNYFRLCAAGGERECQNRLAHLMFDAPSRPDYEYEQALAWFGLAADHGSADAREVVERESPKLTPAQSKTIATLKRQFSGTIEQAQ
jgi:TonB family protein